MKALTIKQPWAQLIVDGIKDIENRTWKTNFRGRVYIHASQKAIPMNGLPNGFNPTKEQWQDLVHNHWDIKEGRLPDLMAAYPCSAIIGEVEIIDCVLNHTSIWAQHIAKVIKVIDGVKTTIDVPVYNWVLANPVKYYEPILNIKGALSFWDPKLILSV